MNAPGPLQMFQALRERISRMCDRPQSTPIVRVEVWLGSTTERRVRCVAGEAIPTEDPPARTRAIESITQDVVDDLAFAYGELTYRIEAYRGDDKPGEPCDAREITLPGSLSLPGVPTSGSDDQRSRQMDRENTQFFANLASRSFGAGFDRLERECGRAWKMNDELSRRVRELETQLDDRLDKKAQRDLAFKLAEDEGKTKIAMWEKASAVLHTIILNMASGTKHAGTAQQLALAEFVGNLDAADLTHMLAKLAPEKQLLAMQLVKAQMDASDGKEILQLAQKAAGGATDTKKDGKGN